MVANNISTLLQRVAGSSVQEIDRLMTELHTLRELLQSEGARVQREITEYAHLSQSAMQSTKVITESLAKWKGEGASRVRPKRARSVPDSPAFSRWVRSSPGIRQQYRKCARARS